VGQPWCVAIAFARVDPEQNPNVASTDPAVYTRAMLVAFASARRWNPEMPLVLVTDAPVDAAYAPAFAELGVETRLTPFHHRPPEGFTSRFAASAYQLDAIQACAEATVFLDPDMVCVRSLTSLTTEVGLDRVGALPIHYAVDHDVNGLSRRQAEPIHVALGEPAKIPVHYGGECYAVPGTLRGDLLVRCELAWDDSLDRWRAGLPHFVTEEHVLSFALRGLDVVSLEPYVKRIWTAARHRNVTGSEYELSLWHVPAEKGRGFDVLFDQLSRRSSWFWSAPEEAWRRHAARALGILNRTPRRLVRDSAGRAARRLQERR
jgi:hypothetical protein